MRCGSGRDGCVVVRYPSPCCPCSQQDCFWRHRQPPHCVGPPPPCAFWVVSIPAVCMVLHLPTSPLHAGAHRCLAPPCVPLLAPCSLLLAPCSWLLVWWFQGITGSKMEKVCDRIHITLNKNSVHGDRSAVTPGGVRIGSVCACVCVWRTGCRHAHSLHGGARHSPRSRLVDSRKMTSERYGVNL